MDYRYLDAFLAAGTSLNFSIAARSLNITPAALSRQIRLFEESVGYQLFIRSPQQVELTAMGQELYLAANQFRSKTDSILDKSRPKLIRIGVLSPILDGFLAEAISRHYKHNKRISFKITTGSPSMIVTMMERGELDIGLSNRNIQTDLLTSKKWLSEKPVIISKSKIDLKKLNQYRWIIVEDKDYIINYAYKKRIKKSELISYIDTPFAQLKLVREGFGIAMVSNWMTKNIKGLKVTEVKEFKEENFYITQLNSSLIDEDLSEFIDLISQP